MSRKYIRNAGVRKMSGKGKITATSHSNKASVVVRELSVRELSVREMSVREMSGKGNVW